MKECEFEYNEQMGVYRCTVCGREIKAPKDTIVSAYCKIQTPNEKLPTLTQKALHYVAAVVQHYATGANTRPNEEVEALLTICQQCENYNSVLEICRVCGCRCTNGSNAFFNKLRMASQHCPRGKW